MRNKVAKSFNVGGSCGTIPKFTDAIVAGGYIAGISILTPLADNRHAIRDRGRDKFNCPLALAKKKILGITRPSAKLDVKNAPKMTRYFTVGRATCDMTVKKVHTGFYCA